MVGIRWLCAQLLMVTVIHFSLALNFVACVSAAPLDEDASDEDTAWLEERRRFLREAQDSNEQPDTALTAARRALALDREHLPTDVDRLSESALLVIDLALVCGDTALAEKASNELHETLSRELAPDHWRLSTARIARDGVTFFKKLSVENQRKVSETMQLDERAASGLHENRFTEGFQAAETAERINREILGEQNHRYALSLSNLALLNHALGRLDAAEQQFRRTLEIRSPLYGPEHPIVAETLIRLGQVLRSRAQYSDAYEQYAKAEQILRRWHDSDKDPGITIELANLLNSLGLLCKTQSKFSDAIRHYEDCLKIMQDVYPPDQFPKGHANLAALLNNIAMLSAERGDFDSATMYGERSLQMLHRLFPTDENSPGHPFLASALKNNGDYQLRLGNHQKARRYYEKSLEINNRLFPTSKYPQGHENIAESLMAYGQLLREIGDYSESERQLKSALQMVLQLYSAPAGQKPNTEVAEAWYVLGVTYQHQMRMADAKQCFEKSAEIRRQISVDNPGTIELALCLNHLGETFASLNEPDSARRCFTESLDILERIFSIEQFPKGHPIIAATRNAFGSALLRSNVDAGLEQLAAAQRMLDDLSVSADDPTTFSERAINAENMGIGLLLAGRHQQAVEKLADAFRLQFHLTESFVAAASENESLTFINRLSQLHDALLTLAPYTQDGDAYEHIWNGRRAVQRLLSARHRHLASAAQPEAEELFEQYLDTRFQIGAFNLATMGWSQQPRTQPVDDVKALLAKKEELERRLAELVPGFNQELKANRSSFTDLVALLPEKTILVDIVFYHRIEPSRKPDKLVDLHPSYAAFVMRSNEPIARVDLGLAEPIDAAIEKWRDAIDQNAAPEDSANHQLRMLVWDKLADAIPAGTSTIYICPDRRLSSVPWPALEDASGKILLEQYEIALVPHAHYLLHELQDTSQSSSNSALLVGNINYDAAVVNTTESSNRINASTQGAETVRPHWRPLPASEREIDLLREYFPDETTIKLLANEATTDNVVENLRHSRMAHFATHGFFARADLAQGASKHDDPIAQRNPLIMSGLVFAGANQPAEWNEFGIPQGDGGILSAEAIAGLRLTELELVVLSACSTGLGELKDAEGVFGLQRAFHMAGAKNVVASLWRVDDQAAAALMQLFYHARIVEKKGVRQALREAQLTLYRNPELIAEAGSERGINFSRPISRTDAPARSQHTATRLWAGFVLSGIGE